MGTFSLTSSGSQRMGFSRFSLMARAHTNQHGTSTFQWVWLTYKLLIKSALQDTKGQSILTRQRLNVQLSFPVDFLPLVFFWHEWHEKLWLQMTLMWFLSILMHVPKKKIPLNAIDAVCMAEHLPKELEISAAGADSVPSSRVRNSNVKFQSALVLLSHLPNVARPPFVQRMIS